MLSLAPNCPNSAPDLTVSQAPGLVLLALFAAPLPAPREVPFDGARPGSYLSGVDDELEGEEGCGRLGECSGRDVLGHCEQASPGLEEGSRSER